MTEKYNKHTDIKNTANPLVYTNMGWLWMAATEGRVAKPERRWVCSRGTSTSVSRLMPICWLANKYCYGSALLHSVLSLH